MALLKYKYKDLKSICKCLMEISVCEVPLKMCIKLEGGKEMQPYVKKRERREKHGMTRIRDRKKFNRAGYRKSSLKVGDNFCDF